MTESVTRRQSSRTEVSTTLGEEELRHWEIARLPGSECGSRWEGADRRFWKIEATANFWREGWGSRVFSRRGEYGSIQSSVATCHESRIKNKKQQRQGAFGVGSWDLV
ncbi:hypothetical protein PIB30_034174 [Stylosanthes scabra]|uniref:Uncharacterized protein n=1 Tax=Stylosanthes scabra TaxID=79078 RepID=A0ABU6YBQ3_9FABA|nr:hypothetical protein [Stylosanthes scabra]